MTSILRNAGCVAALLTCVISAQAKLTTVIGVRPDQAGQAPSGAALTAHDDFVKGGFVSVAGTETFSGFTTQPPLHSDVIKATISCDPFNVGNGCELTNASGAGRYDTTGDATAKFLSSILDQDGSITITFDSTAGVDAFGLYLTDVGDFGGGFDAVLVDVSGKETTVNLAKASVQAAEGNLIFFGFYDDTTKYKSIRLVNGDPADVFGVDDMMLAAFNPTTPPPVPEPMTPLLAMGALAAMGMVRRLRR